MFIYYSVTVGEVSMFCARDVILCGGGGGETVPILLYCYVHQTFSQTSVLGNGRVAHRYGRSHRSVL